MSADQYTADEVQMREAWRAFTGPNRDGDFDRFLARVRRDAANDELRERELDYWMDRAYNAEARERKAEARIKAVRELHVSDDHGRCYGCYSTWPGYTEEHPDWPCATIRALEA